jgi:rubrerythrin
MPNDSGVTRRRLLLAAAPAAPAGRLVTQLEALLRLEQATVLAYRHLAAHPQVDAHVAGTLSRFAAHEQAHVDAIAAALRERGVRPAKGASGLSATQRVLTAHGLRRRLGAVRSGDDIVRLAVEVEDLAARAYYRAVAKLQDPSLITTAAEILACEAQHAVALRALERHAGVNRTVPSPFVTGRR